jgi:hypothetical protein
MMIGTREEVTAVEAKVAGALLSLLLSLTEASVEEESSTTEAATGGEGLTEIGMELGSAAMARGG